MVSMRQYLAFWFVQEFLIKMFLPTPSFAMTHYLCPTVQFSPHRLQVLLLTMLNIGAINHRKPTSQTSLY